MHDMLLLNTYYVLLFHSGGRIQYGRIDSNVTMQCGSLDNDASVTWKVNGTDVKAKRREEGPRLILLEVDMSSNGLYSCFQNPDGQRRDQITFRIGREFNRCFSVLFPSFTFSWVLFCLEFSLLFLVHLSFFAILHSACFPDSFLIVWPHTLFTETLYSLNKPIIAYSFYQLVL